MFRVGFRSDANCSLCNDIDSLLHTFLECPNIQPLLGVISTITSRLVLPGQAVNIAWFFINPPVKNSVFIHRRAMSLFVYLSTMAKLCIHLARRNVFRNQGPVDPLDIFKSKIFSRLRLEFEYHRLNENLHSFNIIWAFDDILCDTHDGQLNFHI